MDSLNHIIFSSERKKGQHLQAEDRGAIQQLHALGYSNRQIAKLLNCSPSTIGYELKRGTLPYKGKGRLSSYKAKRGARVYKVNRSKCHRPPVYTLESPFIRWMKKKVFQDGWSLDASVGFARKAKLFPIEQIPCTKTLYNMAKDHRLPITLFDLPEILMRKKRKQNTPKHKHSFGRSISERSATVSERKEFGHWEGDTVLGRKGAGECVLLTLVERMSDHYIAIIIPEKTTAGVACAVDYLKDLYGSKFNEVFKSITVDNGSEFAALSSLECETGTKIYYAHPYSAWERGINERHNRMLRRFIPKGTSLSKYNNDACLEIVDKINSMPRKRLDYATPEELFEKALDKIYAC